VIDGGSFGESLQDVASQLSDKLIALS
jgi:hypothetical protein